MPCHSGLHLERVHRHQPGYGRRCSFKSGKVPG